MTKWILVFFFFSLTCLICFLFLSKFGKKKRTIRRMEEFIPAPEKITEEAQKKKKEFIVSNVSNLFKGFRYSENTKTLLVQAGTSMQPEEYLTYRFISLLALVLIVILFRFSWYLILPFAIVGFVIPTFYLSYKRKKRLNNLPQQIIDTLGMMSNSMRSGFSFLQAMQLVGKEMPDPIGPEFERVVREVGLGIQMEKVFEDLILRLPNKELEVALQAIMAQRKSGGNLSELLETLEDTIRGRVSILGELKTLTAQGKLSSLVITFLPIGIGGYLYFINHDYFAPMFHHPLGIMLMIFSVLSVMFGWVLIQKIIKIEV